MWRILLLKDTQQTLGCQGRIWYSSIRAWPGKVIFSSGESIGLTHLGEAADTFEKAWAGGYISGNEYTTITNLCVPTLLLSQDDWGGVGGSAANKLTLRYFYSL